MQPPDLTQLELVCSLDSDLSLAEVDDILHTLESAQGQDLVLLGRLVTSIERNRGDVKHDVLPWKREGEQAYARRSDYLPMLRALLKLVEEVQR